MLSLTKQIHQTFNKAALQHEAAKGLNGDDWARYREILAGHEKQQRKEQQAYHREYDTRVEAVRKSLINQAATKSRPLLPRFLGRDGFDRTEINRQAHRVVQLHHEQLLERLAVNRDGQITDFFGVVQKRHDLGNLLKEDFARATNRRSEQERRSGPTR